MQKVPLPLFGHAEFRKLAEGMWKMSVQDRKTQAPKRKFGVSSPSVYVLSARKDYSDHPF